MRMHNFYIKAFLLCSVLCILRGYEVTMYKESYTLYFLSVLSENYKVFDGRRDEAKNER